MADLSLSIPQSIVDALPEDGENARRDMERAVSGWERQLERLLDEAEDAGGVVRMVDRFETRWERYDDYVVELRAWGQSPIYAMAWRDLLASVLRQVYEHEDLGDRIDRERNARIVEDGIRKEG